MDHNHFQKTLDDQTKAYLSDRRNGPGMLRLIGHVGTLGIAGTYIAQGGPYWQTVVVPYGIVLVFLFTLEHETTHRTPFASQLLNDSIGRLSGFVLILPFEWFRYFHLAHHKFTNDPENDPELIQGRPQTRMALLIYASGFPYYISMVQTVLKNALGRTQAPWLPQRAIGRVILEARVAIAIYIVVLSSLMYTDLLLWVWIIPTLLGQPFLRVYLLAEHGHCPAVANMFENSRTTFTARIVRFFAWNMPYHAEHHAFPNVPFWKLPTLHKLARPHLCVTANGYVEFLRDFARKPWLR